jgi:glycine/D-amino acid oxidase-like deaminating enzyme
VQSDILIIGGGLAGCAMAYFLVRAGAGVLLVEQHDLNTHASGSNSGSLHAQIPYEPFLEQGLPFARGFQPVIPLMTQSIELWKELETELGADFEVNTPGGLLVAATKKQMADVKRKAALEKEAGLEIHLLGRDELRKLAPYISEKMVGASYCPREGKANPLKAATSLAAAAERLGARIERRTKVENIRKEEDAFTVQTGSSELSAKRIVNCAGAEAGQMARMVGLDLAIEGFPIQVSVTEPVEPLVHHLVYSAGDRLTLKQTRHGGLMIGGGWPALHDATTGRLLVDPSSTKQNLIAAMTMVPALRAVHLLRTWPAMVNGTADWRPIFGEAPNVRGFYTCMFPWMGFTAGPLSARLVADLIMGRKPPKAFAPFFL